MSRTAYQLLSLTALVTLLAGCANRGAPKPTVHNPAVQVSNPIQREVTNYADYTGRTAAPNSVQIRARVSGYLDKINFKEGADVEANQILFEIDPQPYETALAQAKAQIPLQQAQLKYNEAVYQRNKGLVGQAASVEETQQSLAQRNVSEANLQAAKAAAEQAQINLNWTKVRTPISGMAGRWFLTPGNLVIADQTVLTTVVSIDPIYAYFDVDERTVLQVQQLIREGKVQSARGGAQVPVHLGLATEKGFPHEGTVDFINNQVDPATGTLLIRGIFPNPKPDVGPRVLSPGLFVRIRVNIGTSYPALLVSQQAVGTDQDITYVYVLDEKNAVVRRNVELGIQVGGGLQVVTSGIQANDRVLITGLQQVRPGMTVEPQVVPMPDHEQAQTPFVTTPTKMDQSQTKQPKTPQPKTTPTPRKP